jgi:hypothetical protein
LIEYLVLYNVIKCLILLLNNKIGVGSLVPDTLAHGKKSIAIDLKQKGGIELIKTLTLKSDVLIEPFRKGITRLVSFSKILNFFK